MRTAGKGRTRTADANAAQEHYRREKERRARRQATDSELMEAAKREYLALLEAEAAKGKGGRPKKKPVKPETGASDELEE
jgi:polyphosphate kinase 2 (PPK2 family)